MSAGAWAPPLRTAKPKDAPPTQHDRIIVDGNGLPLTGAELDALCALANATPPAEAREDVSDVQEATEALAEAARDGTITLDELKADLALGGEDVSGLVQDCADVAAIHNSDSHIGNVLRRAAAALTAQASLIAECRGDVAKIEQHTHMEIGGTDKYEQFRKWVRGRCLALLSRIDALGKETRE